MKVYCGQSPAFFSRLQGWKNLFFRKWSNGLLFGRSKWPVAMESKDGREAALSVAV
jgi:hypothetical protein